MREKEVEEEEAFATRCAATRESRNTFAEIRFRDGLFLRVQRPCLEG